MKKNYKYQVLTRLFHEILVKSRTEGEEKKEHGGKNGA